MIDRLKDELLGLMIATPVAAVLVAVAHCVLVAR